MPVNLKALRILLCLRILGILDKVKRLAIGDRDISRNALGDASAAY